MSDTIRQQIITNIDTRLKTILTTGGYATNLGSHVFWWKEPPFQATDLPAINCKDRVEEINDELKTFEADGYALAIGLELFFEGSSSIAELRKGIADIVKAVRTDETWTNLAIRSEIGNGEIQSVQLENIEAAVLMPLIIYYRTAVGNPLALLFFNSKHLSEMWAFKDFR